MKKILFKDLQPYKKIIPLRFRRLIIISMRKIKKLILFFLFLILFPFRFVVKKFLGLIGGHANKDNYGHANQDNYYNKLNKKIKKIKSDVEKIPLCSISKDGSVKRLLFIESNSLRDTFEDIMDLFVSSEILLVFRTKKDYVCLVDFLSDNGVCDGFDRITYIPTIDPKLDEIVYGLSDRYSRILLNICRKEFSSYGKFRKFSRYVKFIKVGVSDRFVGWVRNYYYLSSFIENNSIHEFYCYGNTSKDTNLLAYNISVSKKVSSYIIDNNFCSEGCGIYDYINRNWIDRKRAIITKYHIKEECEFLSEFILFFGNLSDPMYRGTMEPVLQNISKNHNFDLLVIPPYKVDAFKDGNINCLPPDYCHDDLPALTEFNKLFDRALDLFLLDGFRVGPYEGILRLYVSLNARKSLNRILRDCFGLMLELDETLISTKLLALISNPGRLWPSQFLVGYLSSVPSFELQSGTLSRSKRYKAPNSQYILAVDDFSKSVYVDFLGVDEKRVEVVGAPRIDGKLSDIRCFSKTESRIHIFGDSFTDKILCLATQPYDIEIMGSMVDRAKDFIASHRGWFLLVSMHPNENEAFKNKYKSVLGDAIKHDHAMISRGNIYHNLNASDHVITYFSTAGLEAFCLGKSVSSYRPAEYSSVPFDLCELGIAKSFTTSVELESLIIDPSTCSEPSEGLQRLRDGRSADRIVDFVLARLAIEECGAFS